MSWNTLANAFLSPRLYRIAVTLLALEVGLSPTSARVSLSLKGLRVGEHFVVTAQPSGVNATFPLTPSQLSYSVEVDGLDLSQPTTFTVTQSTSAETSAASLPTFPIQGYAQNVFDPASPTCTSHIWSFSGCWSLGHPPTVSEVAVLAAVLIEVDVRNVTVAGLLFGTHVQLTCRFSLCTLTSGSIADQGAVDGPALSAQSLRLDGFTKVVLAGSEAGRAPPFPVRGNLTFAGSLEQAGDWVVAAQGTTLLAGSATFRGTVQGVGAAPVVYVDSATLSGASTFADVAIVVQAQADGEGGSLTSAEGNNTVHAVAVSSGQRLIILRDALTCGDLLQVVGEKAQVELKNRAVLRVTQLNVDRGSVTLDGESGQVLVTRFTALTSSTFSSPARNTSLYLESKGVLQLEGRLSFLGGGTWRIEGEQGERPEPVPLTLKSPVEAIMPLWMIQYSRLDSGGLPGEGGGLRVSGASLLIDSAAFDGMLPLFTSATVTIRTSRFLTHFAGVVTLQPPQGCLVLESLGSFDETTMKFDANVTYVGHASEWTTMCGVSMMSRSELTVKVGASVRVPYFSMHRDASLDIHGPFSATLLTTSEHHFMSINLAASHPFIVTGIVLLAPHSIETTTSSFFISSQRASEDTDDQAGPEVQLALGELQPMVEIRLLGKGLVTMPRDVDLKAVQDGTLTYTTTSTAASSSSLSSFPYGFGGVGGGAGSGSGSGSAMSAMCSASVRSTAALAEWFGYVPGKTHAVMAPATRTVTAASAAADGTDIVALTRATSFNGEAVVAVDAEAQVIPAALSVRRKLTMVAKGEWEIHVPRESTMEARSTSDAIRIISVGRFALLGTLSVLHGGVVINVDDFVAATSSKLLVSIQGYMSLGTASTQTVTSPAYVVPACVFNATSTVDGELDLILPRGCIGAPGVTRIGGSGILACPNSPTGGGRINLTEVFSPTETWEQYLDLCFGPLPSGCKRISGPDGAPLVFEIGESVSLRSEGCVNATTFLRDDVSVSWPQGLTISDDGTITGKLTALTDTRNISAVPANQRGLGEPFHIYIKVVQYLCPKGRFCPSRDVELACDPGYYCPESATKMEKCELRSYCPSNSSAPTPCPAGSFCENPAVQANCTQDGSYCPTGMLSMILLCRLFRTIVFQ